MEKQKKRRLIRTTLILGLFTLSLGGCAEPGYGYNEYPAYGYVPYGYESPLYVRGYGRDFDHHGHRFEEGAFHGGHFVGVEHAPLAAAHFGGGHMGGFGAGMRSGGFGGHGGGFGGGHGGGGHGGGHR